MTVNDRSIVLKDSVGKNVLEEIIPKSLNKDPVDELGRRVNGGMGDVEEIFVDGVERVNRELNPSEERRGPVLFEMKLTKDMKGGLYFLESENSLLRKNITIIGTRVSTATPPSFLFEKDSYENGEDVKGILTIFNSEGEEDEKNSNLRSKQQSTISINGHYSLQSDGKEIFNRELHVF